ncbi:TlpA disulfide reductase family protein [Kamptonema cortianum]|nr:TlpA disulfide reductase family protein [Geitlerinema splendidum]MDK3158691.1 TlpA disulfide reductase family protein [Kamptonema cortianum]
MIAARFASALFAVGFCSLAVAQAPGDKIVGPGDPAPPIKVKSWIKGDAVKTFEKGKVYVVDFWTSWYGPCSETIPLLNELAKEYSGKATFIGLNIWEDPNNPEATVREFVRKMGSNMNYAVAMDLPDRTMSTTWLEAARQEGIPSTFLIDKTGKVAWIGHPFDLAPALKAVLENKFDVKVARAEFDKKIASVERQREIASKIETAMRLYVSGRKEQAKSDLNALESELTESHEILAVRGARLEMLVTDSPDEAKSEIVRYLEGSPKLSSLFMIAEFSMRQAIGENGNRELAKFASDRVLEKMTTDEPVVLYHCSVAPSILKDHRTAATLLERALKAFDNGPYANQPDMRSFRDQIAKALAIEKSKIGH